MIILTLLSEVVHYYLHHIAGTYSRQTT